eukprot:COSAG05_NODE_71_length_22071_cov_17.527149_13_plen_443_part_00
MISFGAKKNNASAVEQVKTWAASALEDSSVFPAGVTLMVAEIECKEEGCPPVETVVSILDPAKPQKVKIIKGVEEVTEEDVRFAVGRLNEEALSAPFSITVKTPVGTKVEVTTQALETICDVKTKVAEASGLPKARLRLMYLGNELTDHLSVAQSGLKGGCVVEHGIGAAYFWQGEGTLAVGMELHAKNRKRLLAEFLPKQQPNVEMAGFCYDVPPNSHILLAGGKSAERYDTDHEPVFRQESFFHWAFGVTEPDCYGALDIDAQRSVLFVPRLPAEYAVWMGEILSAAHFKQKYGVDEVKYTDELDAYFTELDKLPPAPPVCLYTLHGQNTDSGSWAKEAEFEGIEKYRTDRGRLFPIIVELRVFKTAEELAVLRYVSDVTSKAHMEVMRQCRPGLREYQMESLFQHYVYEKGGCRNCAYTCICATGPNPSILHYGHAVSR